MRTTIDGTGNRIWFAGTGSGTKDDPFSDSFTSSPDPALIDSQSINVAAVQNLALAGTVSSSTAVTTSGIYLSGTHDCWITLDGSAPAVGTGIFLPKGTSYVFKVTPAVTIVKCIEYAAETDSYLSIVESL